MIPIKHQHPWTEEDDAELRRLYRSTVLLKRIPDLVGRTVHAVHRRAGRLKLRRIAPRPSVRTHFKCRVHGWIHPTELALRESDGRVVCPTCGRKVRGIAYIPEAGLTKYEY